MRKVYGDEEEELWRRCQSRVMEMRIKVYEDKEELRGEVMEMRRGNGDGKVGVMERRRVIEIRKKEGRFTGMWKKDYEDKEGLGDEEEGLER